MPFFGKLYGVAMLLFLVGCATTQQPVALKVGLYEDVERIVVVMASLPEANTFFPGAGCLLCIATAEGLHGKLGKHAGDLDGSEFKLSKTALADRLLAKGVDALVIDEPVSIEDLPKSNASGDNTVSRDFSGIAGAHDASHVLVLSVSQMGFSRAFASYVPTEAPVAIVKGVGYLVDTRDNTYVWYQPFDVARGVEGEWDQPPDFPKLTSAFYRALAEARDQVLENF